MVRVRLKNKTTLDTSELKDLSISTTFCTGYQFSPDKKTETLTSQHKGQYLWGNRVVSIFIMFSFPFRT